MKRILLLHRDLPISGGITRSFLTLIEASKGLDICFSVASVELVIPEASSSAFARLGMPLHSLGNGFISQVRGLKRLVGEIETDAIVCTAFRPWLIGKIVQALTGTSVVFWMPGIPIMQSWWKRRLFRYIGRNDPLLFISQAVRDAHVFPKHRGLSAVSYYGIEDATGSATNKNQRADARKELNIPPEAFAVGYMAEFTPWKKHSVLLDAMDVLPDNVIIVFFGTGHAEEQVRRLASRLGDRVFFAGVRENVRELLPALDVYSHPAGEEGFGRAIAEAMLAELPVIVADKGAAPELVKNNCTGLVTITGDSVSMASAIDILYLNKRLRLELAAAGRASAIERFSPQRYATEFFEFISRSCL